VARFRSGLRSSTARGQLDELEELLGIRTAALLCFERRPSQCHRAVVAETLLDRNPHLSVSHL
jgi:hypothetical protein